MLWCRIGRSFLQALLILLILSGCAPQTTISRLSSENLPLFGDDLPSASLLSAIGRQLEYLQNQPRERLFQLGESQVTSQELIDSLKTFRAIIAGNPAPAELNRLIRERFYVFQAAGRKQDPAGIILLTGYYEPLFAGSLTKTEEFRYPLYRKPSSLLTRSVVTGATPELGRFDTDSTTFTSYWTRQQIETGNLLAGDELVYLSDPLDAYLLHVQGSGRIQLPDGNIRSIQFAGTNGHEYNSLGKLFVDRKIMALEDVSIPAIRHYFKEHPEQLQAMLHHNPRYVFFRWAGSEEPRGSLGQPLTPGRSIAIDPAVLPTGCIGFLESYHPVFDESGKLISRLPFKRFVVPQDSGSAIKGPGRADLFWGRGAAAEAAAGHMKEPGRLYFLLSRDPAKPGKSIF